MNFVKTLGLAICLLTGCSISAEAKLHHYGSNESSNMRACLRPSARALLNRIESHFGRVHIISTCRPGAVIATSGRPSKHRYGLAIDFEPIHASKRAVVNWLIRNHHNGGTMTYSDMGHIHVDIGPHFVALNSWSGHTPRRYARSSRHYRHYASRSYRRYASNTYRRHYVHHATHMRRYAYSF